MSKVLFEGKSSFKDFLVEEKSSINVLVKGNL